MSYFDFDPLLQKGVEFAKTRRPLFGRTDLLGSREKVRMATNQVRSGDGVFYSGISSPHATIFALDTCLQ